MCDFALRAIVLLVFRRSNFKALNHLCPLLRRGADEAAQLPTGSASIQAQINSLSGARAESKQRDGRAHPEIDVDVQQREDCIQRSGDHVGKSSERGLLEAVSNDLACRRGSTARPRGTINANQRHRNRSTGISVRVDETWDDLGLSCMTIDTPTFARRRCVLDRLPRSARATKRLLCTQARFEGSPRLAIKRVRLL